jgi:hypothetical protein
MKNRIFLTRSLVSILLSISLLALPFRLSARASTPATIKTESQYRAEASRYDAAVRAIAGIITMKLETTDELKAALNIVQQHRQNLKLFWSKLIVLALSNSTFSTAVKRKIPTLDAATTFLSSLTADKTKLTTVNGFDDVKTQIANATTTDAAVLRRASDRLKTAADRLKAAQRIDSSSELRLVRASFSPAEESPAVPTLQDPLTFALFLGYVAVVVIVVVAFGSAAANNATDEGRDAVAECQERANANYDQCVATTLFGQLGCAAKLLAEQAICLAFPDQVR